MPPWRSGSSSSYCLDADARRALDLGARNASAPTWQPSRLHTIEAEALATQIIAVADRELVDQEAEVRGHGGPPRPGKRPYRLHDTQRKMLGEVLRTIGDPSTLGEDRDRLGLLERLLDVLARDDRLSGLAASLTVAEASVLRASCERRGT